MGEAAQQMVTMSAADFERLKTELARDLIKAVREELGRRAPPANDDDNGMLATDQAFVYCGFKKRKSFLMHITRGNLVPDVWGSRGLLKEHRFKRATLDNFMKGQGKE